MASFDTPSYDPLTPAKFADAVNRRVEFAPVPVSCSRVDADRPSAQLGFLEILPEPHKIGVHPDLWPRFDPKRYSAGVLNLRLANSDGETANAGAVHVLRVPPRRATDAEFRAGIEPKETIYLEPLLGHEPSDETATILLGRVAAMLDPDTEIAAPPASSAGVALDNAARNGGLRGANLTRTIEPNPEATRIPLNGRPSLDEHSYDPALEMPQTTFYHAAVTAGVVARQAQDFPEIDSTQYFTEATDSATPQHPFVSRTLAAFRTLGAIDRFHR